MPSRRKKSKGSRGTTGGVGPLRRLGNSAGLGSFYKTEVKSVGGNPVLSTPSVVGGFPEKLKTVLRYEEILSLTATSGVPSSYIYRGNSVFDPNQTGTGGQPANFDDLAVHYDFYRVLSSRITCIFNNGSNSNVPGMAVVVPTYSTSLAASLQDFAAQPFALTGVVSNASNPLTLSMEMATSKMVGQTRQVVLASDLLASLVSTNPTKQWYWQLNWGALDGSTTLNSQTLVSIEYEVEFFGRISGGLDATLERILKLKKLFGERRLLKEGAVDAKTESSIEEGYVALQALKPVMSSGGSVVPSARSVSRGDETTAGFASPSSKPHGATTVSSIVRTTLRSG